MTCTFTDNSIHSDGLPSFGCNTFSVEEPSNFTAWISDFEYAASTGAKTKSFPSGKRTIGQNYSYLFNGA